MGKSGTYLTDARAIEEIIGPLPSGVDRITLTVEQARRLEGALGLRKQSLNGRSILSRVPNVAERAPTSPIVGNEHFLGPGKGLPGGGPEVKVSAIPSVGGSGITQILVEVKGMTGVTREERPCRTVPCPACGGAIRFVTMRMIRGPEPFLYCNSCSNILDRESDRKKVQAALNRRGSRTEDEVLHEHYLQLESSAPPCPCGGRFELWANVKCPHCQVTVPYSSRDPDLHVRLNDETMVVLDQAMVLGNDDLTTFHFFCEPSNSAKPGP